MLNRQTETTDLIRRLLLLYGQDLNDANLFDTPTRVARVWEEFFNYEDKNIHSLFPEKATNHQMVVVTQIPFYTYCAHHLLPFHGTASIGYLPTEKVLGISKLPRLVKLFSHQLQLQERMGRQIADKLSNVLEETELGIIVVLEATHLCCSARGIESPSKTITRYATGEFTTNDSKISEFYMLCNQSQRAI